MNGEFDFVPVRKVIKIINSCETYSQLKSCEKLINAYVDLVKMKGVINSDLVRKRLLKEYNQKKFQLKMIKSFIRRQKEEFTKEITIEMIKVA